MSIVTPIPNEPGCSTAACHARDGERRVLGVLDLTLDLGRVDRELADLRQRSLVITLVTVAVIAAFLFFVIRRLLDRPVRALVEGTKAVAHLDLDQAIEVGSSTELGTLATSFNVMQDRLREARARNEEFLQQLEQKVEDRSRELAATQEKLVQSDRLASLGQLAASVAHEVNNPISAVLNLSVFLQRILKEDGIPPDRLPDFRRHLRQISDETARAGRIVTDLLTFSRRSSPRRSPADLNAVVNDALSLVGHRMELAGIQVATDLAQDLPLVPCDRGHIQQVLINLALNAVEALQGKGRIQIRTRADPARREAVLEVEDDGPGIPKEMIHRIFDPFFSTKLGEKGVGLGLSVAYGIVEAHGGRLTVRSTVGRGTTFAVRLPLDGANDGEGVAK
jgi:two-component system NtrC family sensor kinase